MEKDERDERRAQEKIKQEFLFFNEKKKRLILKKSLRKCLDFIINWLKAHCR